MHELLADVLHDYRMNGKDEVWAEQKIRLHLEPAFGHQVASKLTTAQVEAYKATRKTAEAKNATINRELAILKRAFRLGIRSTPQKVGSVPYIRMLAEEQHAEGVL